MESCNFINAEHQVLLCCGVENKKWCTQVPCSSERLSPTISASDIRQATSKSFLALTRGSLGLVNSPIYRNCAQRRNGRQNKIPSQARRFFRNKSPGWPAGPIRRRPQSSWFSRSGLGSGICLSKKFPQQEDSSEGKESHHKMNIIIHEANGDSPPAGFAW